MYRFSTSALCAITRLNIYLHYINFVCNHYTVQRIAAKADIYIQCTMIMGESVHLCVQCVRWISDISKAKITIYTLTGTENLPYVLHCVIYN